ncbi:MAG: DUF805 domain-containing protein [Pseudomonadota bacterium]
MNWYVDVLKKYVAFGGRARRKEYWMFMLINALIVLALGMVDRTLGTWDAALSLGAVSGLYSLAVFLPSLGVTIRRLHDSDKTGWWFLAVFVPIIGALILLIFMVTPGTKGSNKYGPDPIT